MPMLMPLFLVVGLGALLANWVLPMVSYHFPRRLQIALLACGLAMVIGGALSIVSARAQKARALQSSIHYFLRPMP